MTDIQDAGATKVTVGEDDPKTIAIEAGMTAAGVSTSERVQADYFGFEEILRYTFPDGVSYVEHKILNEGARRQYLKSVNRDVRVQKVTGDALMRMSAGEEKIQLMMVAIVGWNLIKEGHALNFNTTNLTKFFNEVNPKITDLIYKEIIQHNPWLLSEMSVEDIDREIEGLQEMRRIKVEEDEGKANS